MAILITCTYSMYVFINYNVLYQLCMSITDTTNLQGFELNITSTTTDKSRCRRTSINSASLLGKVCIDNNTYVHTYIYESTQTCDRIFRKMYIIHTSDFTHWELHTNLKIFMISKS